MQARNSGLPHFCFILIPLLNTTPHHTTQPNHYTRSDLVNSFESDADTLFEEGLRARVQTNNIHIFDPSEFMTECIVPS